MSAPESGLRRALVLGGSGIYGARVTRLLRAEGVAVVATARDAARTPPRRGVEGRAYDAERGVSPLLPGERFDAAFVALPAPHVPAGLRLARAASDVVAALVPFRSPPPFPVDVAYLRCGDPCGDGVYGPFRPWLDADAPEASRVADASFRPLDPRDAARAAVAAARARARGVFRIDGGRAYAGTEIAALVAALRAGRPAPAAPDADAPDAEAEARVAQGFVFRPRFDFAESLAGLLAEAAGAGDDPSYWSA